VFFDLSIEVDSLFKAARLEKFLKEQQKKT
jgi:hypothetical protein